MKFDPEARRAARPAIAYDEALPVNVRRAEIAEAILKKKINLLEISAYLEEMSEELKGKLSADFAAYGVRLVNFNLNSVDVPAEDDTVVRLKKNLAEKAEIDILGDRYQQKRTLDALEKAAANEGGGAGAGLGAGLGLGAGMGMGQMMAGALNPAPSKFCTACGKPTPPAAKFTTSVQNCKNGF
jgi:membrane protease subunit (stomatin/prohibitin family)